MAKGREVPGPGRDQNGTKRDLTLVRLLLPELFVLLKHSDGTASPGTGTGLAWWSRDGTLMVGPEDFGCVNHFV